MTSDGDLGVRLGVSIPGAPTHAEWVRRVKRVEAIGLDSLSVPEHLSPGMFSPMLALASAAEISSHLQLRTLVTNVVLREPAMLAREASTLSLLTEGRFGLGLGLGYRRAELEQAGIRFAPGPTRLELLVELVAILRSAWSGEPVEHDGKHHRLCGHVDRLSEFAPHIPVIVGGNGRQILTFAGRVADGVCFVGVSQRLSGAIAPTDFTFDGFARQNGWVEQARASADRQNPFRKEVLVQHVQITARRRQAAEDVAAWMPGVSTDDIGRSPYVLIGSKHHIRDQISMLRVRFGVTDITVLGGSLSAIEEVLA